LASGFVSKLVRVRVRVRVRDRDRDRVRVRVRVRARVELVRLLERVHAERREELWVSVLLVGGGEHDVAQPP